MRQFVRRTVQALAPRLALVALGERSWLHEREVIIVSCLGDRSAAAFDVGANKGVYTYLMSKSFGTVHAFEPQPELGAYLARAAPRNVTVHRVAVSDRRGEAVLRIRLPERGDAEAPAMQAFHARFARARNGDMIVFLADDSRNEDLRRQLETVRENAESGSMAKNRFLASVSHELRTPLNAIIGFADILDQELFGGFEDARQKEYVGLISRSGQHLLSVVNAILDVSKIESGTYAIHAEAFDFAEAAAMPCSIAEQQAAPKRITLVTSLAPKMDELVADRRAVQQILINLLSNAVKFTPEGGQVTLGARRAGDHFTFWVNDTGIGIAEQDLKRLGQPFMQVQNDYTRQFEGTGLGLSLVKGLVQLHGGMIAIDSAPGEGTCVSITLPATGVRNAPHRLPDAAREEERTSHAPYRKTA